MNIRPVTAWKSPQKTPDVKVGDTETFWLAVKVKRGNEWGVNVFDAQYVNKPLEYEDDDLEKEEPIGDPFYTEDGEPIDAVGWHSLMSHADFNGYYEPICFNENYIMLGWGIYLKPEFQES